LNPFDEQHQHESDERHHCRYECLSIDKQQECAAKRPQKGAERYPPSLFFHCALLVHSGFFLEERQGDRTTAMMGSVLEFVAQT
jgi:hypothetical protein